MHKLIQAAWQRVQHERRPVDALSVYKGLPLVFRATLQDLTDTTVTLKTAGYEAICWSLQPKTTLLSDLLEEAVVATIQNVNVREGTVVLDHCLYSREQLGDRVTLRVEPHATFIAQIQHTDRTYSGTVVDVSLSGVGLLAAPDVSGQLRRGASVRVSLPLPNATLELPALVRYSRATAKVSRLGLAFAPEAPIRSVLDYIHTRRDEILQELRDLYQAAIA